MVRVLETTTILVYPNLPRGPVSGQDTTPFILTPVPSGDLDSPQGVLDMKPNEMRMWPSQFT